MNFTPEQKQAIAARGNVLVIAGAGTGKTRTLVERCLNILLEEKPPVSLEEILMVTFTEAAAAEMRQRIRARLEEELAKTPGEFRWHEQLALFETAHIGTLHSFCLKLICQHFYELELDPQLAVLAEEEARLLTDETLDTVLQGHYAGDGQLAEAVQQLIQTQGRGWDKPIRALVLKLHHYTQTLPEPAGWFRRQLEMFNAPEPEQWRAWLLAAATDWRARSLEFLNPLAAENELAARCVAALEGGGDAPSQTGDDSTMTGAKGRVHQQLNTERCDEGVAATRQAAGRRRFASALEQLREIPAACPPRKKTALLKPLESFFEEVEFLFSLARVAGENDPLAEDWNWTRPHMTALLRLAEEFQRAYADAKRELGALDFHDLEQHALRLLWDTTGQPSAIARQWRQKLRFVFVDEYQDINAAQDKIIEALGRGPLVVPPLGGSPPLPPEGGTPNLANRFLVGDVKQSIYRFRLANPRIFQNYAATWHGGLGETIPLTGNFRSREGLLRFVNSLFALLMQPAIGGLGYDENAKLQFGAPAERHALGSAAQPEPRVELHLRFKGGGGEAGEEDSAGPAGVAELEEAAREARLVALRLRELKAQRHQVWDDAAKSFRAVEWSDMAVLLRSPAGKAESFAKEFSRLAVPLVVARRGFYESLEISDLLNLLQLLDNPLQDLPALAVLHSPLVGLTAGELATIRLTEPKTHFWTALQRWKEEGEHPTSNIQHPTSNGGEGADRLKAELQTDHASRFTPHVSRFTPHAETAAKVGAFLDRFAHWRRLARQVSLSRCLEAVLAETHYAEWLLTQPRGEQRRANVQRLLGLAQRFDQFQRQGLFRFLRFIEAQQAAETEPEVAAASEENAVRLMSIHQSKGLEFPVVVVADLAKAFNFSDLSADMILDEQFGLCPQIKPPQTGQRYPSLPHWLARRRQKLETLGEELRLLYVATTRARDTLILTALVPEKKFAARWRQAGEVRVGDLLAARSYADWLGGWFANHVVAGGESELRGETDLLRWAVHEDAELLAEVEKPAGDEHPEDEFSAEAGVWDKLRERLAWQYPFGAATQRPAKTSVSALRRQAAEWVDEDAQPFVRLNPPHLRSSRGDEAPSKTTETRNPKPEISQSLLTSAATVQTASEISDLKATARAGRSRASTKKSAAEIGTAHHKFLQFVSLDRLGSAEELSREAKRLEQAKVLLAEETALLDFPALAAFWQSELGRKVRAQAQFVRRELPFTARFSPAELGEITGEPAGANLAEEFVVVQGVADLAVVLPEEIWLVDFKTDDVTGGDLAAKARLYEPQLTLYALALARIYRRPVTECWLHFLAAQTTLRVGLKDPAKTRS